MAACAVLLMSMTNKSTDASPIVVDTAAKNWAQEQLNNMSNDQKIGQLFMMAVWSEWDDNKLAEVYSEAIDNQIGGVCFFAGKAGQQAKITNDLNAKLSVPLLVGIDGEWGVGMRVTDAHSFPYAMNLGAVQDSALIYEMGKQIGQHCKRLGVHVNFAPVHDLNSNPLNPVINYRSYGSGITNVAEKAGCYVEGMQSEGVLAVAKHFPGHGDTQTDSHHALPVISKSRAVFESQEFAPFMKSMQDHDLQALMIGHLDVPALDNTGIPTSLSTKVIQCILKEDMGFDGLIISDALNMAAVARGYDKHYLKAFIAGHDILLFPESVPVGIRQLKEGLAQGYITQQELDARVLRVLSYKYALKVHESQPIVIDKLVEDLNPVESKVLNNELYTKSITLVKNDKKLLPIKALDTKKIAAISINNSGVNAFLPRLSSYTEVTTFNEKVVSEQDVQRLLKQLQSYDEVIVALHGNQKSKSRNYSISSWSLKLVFALANKTNVHAVVFANPYALRKISKTQYSSLKSLVFSYGNRGVIQDLTAQALFGGIGFEGKLPLALNSFLPEGMCVTTQACRLGYTSIPEEVDMNSFILDSISSIVDEILTEKMSPGCQILVARKGKVVYNKAFGYTTYDKGQELTTDHIYDVASITKIAASTPLVMQLQDEGIVNIHSTIDHYLPELSKTDKSDLTLEDVLMHQSGLKGYIGFDYNLIDREGLTENLFQSKKSSVYSIPITEHLYMNNTFVFKDNYVSKIQSDRFNVEVAKDLYTFKGYRQEMYHMMDTIPLNKSKDYRYSDLGLYYVMRVLEHQMKHQVDTLAANRLWKPLGMNHTCYTPLKYHDINQIVPTVKEEFFRDQLLQGYVHDQGAALLGGTGSHAGAFSTANDMAKLMQMFLNDGSYGGQSLIKPETVEYFTQHTANGFRRGVGFDKPETIASRPQPTCKAASPSAFGHTGFTGACAWADPSSELIFVFLSNRVYPNTYNTKLFDEDIRPRIQAIIYDAIIK